MVLLAPCACGGLVGVPMSVKWPMAAVIVVAAVFAAAWIFRSCAPEPAPKIPPALQRQLDSLAATATAFEHEKDSLSKIVRVDTVHTIIVNKQAEATKAQAVSLGAKADSLATEARKAQDDADLWEQAYKYRTEERDSLQSAYTQKSNALDSEIEARRKLTVLYVADTLRRNSFEQANAGLQTAISKLEQPCRLLGPIKCPSRTVTMVVTTLTVLTAEHLTKKP